MQHSAFDGVRSKMIRAFELLDDLEAQCEEWETTTHVPITRSREDGWHVWSAGPIAAPPVSISIVAGEVVHQLRSAMDLAANAAITANGQIPDLSASFPILMSEQAWKSNGSQKLKGASPAAVEYVKSVQPAFYKGEGGAHGHELSIIQEINLADKHRKLLALAGSVGGLEGRIIWDHDVAASRFVAAQTNEDSLVFLDEAVAVYKLHVSAEGYEMTPDDTMTFRLGEQFKVEPVVVIKTHDKYRIEFQRGRLRKWAQYVGKVMYEFETVVAKAAKAA